MAKSNNQKAKILYLERILQNSGENHAVSMQEILETLAERGVTAERKSIYDDMAVLREFGMDIRYRRGKPGGYYLAGQPDVLEIKNAPGAEPVQEAIPEPSAEPVQEVIPEPAAEQTQDVIPETAVPPETESVPEEERAAADRRPPSWLGGAQGSRSVKLACENSIRFRVEEAIGENGLYKEKGMTMFTVTAEISETPEFYGWLASLGRQVFIQKPKKTAAAYRDYLKELAREYKGV